LVNPFALPSIGQTWVLASNDAVFEMGDLIRTLKRLLMVSTSNMTQELFITKISLATAFDHCSQPVYGSGNNPPDMISHGLNLGS
jgi:hypothetical protein